MIISTFRNELDAYPVRHEGPWDQLVKSLAEYLPTACTLATCARSECPHKKGRAWSPASWPAGETRSKNTVAEVSCLVIDLDHQAPDHLDAILDRFAVHAYVMHSSHSDSPADRCVRVVVRLSRPVAGRDWPRFWPAAMAAIGAPADPKTKNADRLYFLPSRPSDAAHDAFDGSGFDYAVNAGASLDVDAILAAAPLADLDRPRVDRPIPAFRGAPSPAAYDRAVRALGDAWPSRERHSAQLALAGALARGGWPVDLIGQFCVDVAEIQQPGNGDLPKRLAAARSSREKLEAGEAVSGWPSVEQYVDPAAVRAAMGALGMGLDTDTGFFDDLVAPAPAVGGVSGAAPTRDQVRVAVECARDRGKKSKNPTERYAAKLLAKVLKSEFLSDHADEDREKILRQAAVAVMMVVPAGTTDESVVELLLSPAGALGPEVPAVVAWARQYVAELAIASTDEHDLPDPEDDDQLRSQLLLTDKGSTKNCGSNIERILKFAAASRGVMRFNLLTKQIEITGGRFCAETPGTLPVGIKNWLSSHWDLVTSTSEVAEQVLRISKQSAYDPVSEYLRGLVWDGIPRIGAVDRVGWLTSYCGVVDSVYVRKVGARFLISAVARGLDPGCKVDTLLVLEGLQGAKKSTTIGILGRPWHTDTPMNVGDKDSRMLAASKWIVEVAELASFSKGEFNSYKNFLSQQHDDFRPPYASAQETFPRRCVFFGSTNEHEYLTDPTGNRRWWAVRVGSCDIEMLALDRDQLWAEAVHRYLSAVLHPDQAHPRCPGERWWFEPDEQIEADAEVEDRGLQSPWIDMIERWWVRNTRPAGAAPARTAFSMAEIAVGALDMSAESVDRNNKKLSQVLRAAGLEPVPRREGEGRRARLWYRPGGQRDLLLPVELHDQVQLVVN